METDERPVRRCLSTAFAVTLLAIVPAPGCAAQRSGVSSPVIAPILDRLERGESFSSSEIMKMDRAGVAAQLNTALSSMNGGRLAKVERPALNLVVDLGRPLRPADKGSPPRLAPIVTDPAAIQFLVRELDSADSDVRDDAGTILADQVPDTVLRSHEPAILEALRKHAGTSGAALILGRLGSQAAHDTLESVESIRLTSAEDTEIAEARLGNKEAEGRVIAAYRNAPDAKTKGRQALRVGYIGTPDAVMTLARDMRTSESYKWRMESLRSLRVHLIEGLHRAFPAEPVFWKPPYKPDDDTYYAAIENWLTWHTGVTWNQPRPPFLYEEDAPLFLDRH